MLREIDRYRSNITCSTKSFYLVVKVKIAADIELVLHHFCLLLSRIYDYYKPLFHLCQYFFIICSYKICLKKHSTV